MPKKSLARYVSEIRKELLAKNCQGAEPISRSANIDAKPVKVGGGDVKGSASGGQKRKRA